MGVLEERQWRGNPLRASGERKVVSCCWENDEELGIRRHVAEGDWPNWHFWPSCHIPA